MKSEYAVIADTTAGERIMVDVVKQNGMYAFGGGPLTAAVGYLEGNTPYTVPKDPQAQTLMVTKHEDKGTALMATFTLGELRNANTSRTVTDGVLDIQIVAP